MTPLLDTSHIEGRVEAIAGALVKGWVWDPATPDSAVGVAVVVDGAMAASGPADLHAPGLQEIGVGDGHHAFEVVLPERLADGGRHRITVLAGKRDEVVPPVHELERSGSGTWVTTAFVFVEPEENQSPPDFEDLHEAVLTMPSDPARVALQGRQGWLFDFAPSDIRRLTGEGGAKDSDLEAWLAELERTSATLHEIGLRHVVAIAPSKVHVYPEHAPAGAPPAVADRLGRRLVALGHRSDHLFVVELLDALLAAKDHGSLFDRRGAFWNARGAFFAHRAMLKHAGVPGLSPLELAKAEFVAPLRSHPGTLEKLPQVALVADALLEVEQLSPPGADQEEGAVVADLSILGWKRIPAEAHLEHDGLPAPRVYVRADAADRPRAVVLGHPCIHELTPWIAETTSRLVVLSTPTAPLEQIELEYPDVVFQVLDERYLAEGPPLAEQVVKGVADEPLDSPISGLAEGPVIEREREGERARSEDAGP